ncbi:unnamed protein product [Rhodiola kirilowii]
MGCASSLPDRSSGRLSGVNQESEAAPDAKNLRVKLVLLGDSGVGKSCIVLRFVRGQFDPTSKVTVGASFLSQTIALQDSTTVKFEIWDTAGQERYAALAPLYYRGAGVAVVVYDITSIDSFSKAQYWVKELQKHGSPDIVLALVGNKADLQENREVSVQDGLEYAEKNGMFFIETSAKTADNINQLFEVEDRLRYAPPSALLVGDSCLGFFTYPICIESRIHNVIQPPAKRIRILSVEFWKLNSAHPASWPGPYECHYAWKVPSQGFLKINVDAAWDSSSGEGAVAAIARNDVGIVTVIRCKHLLRAGSALEADGIAIMEDFCLAQDLNCSKFHLATDCLNAYDALFTSHSSRGQWLIRQPC